MRGRKPKPLAMRLAEGDARKVGVRKLKAQIAAEPKASRGLERPAHLKGIAAATWAFWSEELESMNLDCRPDAPMLEGACVAYARAIAADELVDSRGLIVEQDIFDKTGSIVGSRSVPNQAIAISNAAWKNVKAFCSEFGLSPASRTRLTLEKRDETQEELMELLSSPRKPRAEKVQ
jgi:P27 family predicted phage terminase small subunit